MKIKNGKLPRSNYGPCSCNSSEDGMMSEYLPDLVQVPMRKEVSVNAIGPKMKYSDKGYSSTRAEREEMED
jgi:hypothetical protein